MNGTKFEYLKSFREALVQCVTLSGKMEKQIYIPLNIDAGYWSKIMSGLANFPMEKLIHFMEICNNHVPLQWLASQCGYELRVTPKTLEDQLEKERHEKEELKKKLENIYEFVSKLGLKFDEVNK